MNPPAGLERQAALLNMAISLSLRGSYCMYQGEELGLPQADLAFEDLRDPYDISLYPEHAGRDGARTPMPWESEKRHAGFTEATGCWLPVSPAHLELSVNLQENDDNSVLNKYRTFLSFRKNNQVLKHGDIKVIEAHSDLLIFQRELDGDSIFCIYNVSSTPDSLELTTLGLTEASLIKEISYGSELEDLHLSFDPYGYVFLRVVNAGE
jgi:alpha-glucosidase